MEAKLNLSPEGMRIPVIPAGVSDLIAAISNDDLGFQELSSYLERFPGIVARLIALSNSAWSAPSQEITTLEAAIARVGMKVSRSVAIALVVSAPLDTHRCPAFDSVHYWSDALLVADIASLIAADFDQPEIVDPSTARVAGLIHNIGLLVMIDNCPDEMDGCLRSYSTVRDQQPFNVVIEHQLGFSPSGLSGQIAQSWGLPGVFEKAMSFYGDRNYRNDHWQIVNSVSAAIDITAALNRGHDAMPAQLTFPDGLPSKDLLRHQWSAFQLMYGKTQELSQQVFG